MPNNILLTGRPGSGKTTLVLRMVERLDEGGFKAGGFVTEEIREGPQRTGFEVRDLGGGKAILAHVDRKEKPRVGKYGVDVEAFERIALRALEIGKKEADLLVVDEIGRMELFSTLFRSTLLELLEMHVPILATVHAGNDEFTSGIMSREDISLYHLNPAQREDLLEVVDRSIRRILTGV
ncbi:MAG: NTPase [Actinobacteria bacterium]|nr:NTPase [Actinomycetota bacterium]